MGPSTQEGVGIWKDNAYSIEQRFQSLVTSLGSRGEENPIDRLSALDALFETLPEDNHPALAHKGKKLTVDVNFIAHFI